MKKKKKIKKIGMVLYLIVVVIVVVVFNEFENQLVFGTNHCFSVCQAWQHEIPQNKLVQ